MQGLEPGQISDWIFELSALVNKELGKYLSKGLTESSVSPPSELYSHN